MRREQRQDSVSFEIAFDIPRRLKHFTGCILAFVLFAAPCMGQAGPRQDRHPDAACRECHQQIYDRYERTPMAHASGDAVDGLLPGTFIHQPSEVRYRLFLRDGAAWLSYDRPGGAGAEALDGRQRLIYYIGSGDRGRTYLFQRGGFWFESPVNWYAKKQLWDMNPKSMHAKEMPFTLPVDSTCLHCHTTGAATSLPGSRNHFAASPFLQTGIGCESCHGDAAEHLAQRGRGPILNPAKLTGSLRDSICLQCHLEAEIVVNEPNRSLEDFHPGDDLAASVRFFVRDGEIGAAGRATSQWEALRQSACYRKSGGRMSCVTCHNPHNVPAAADKVAWYRSKCLACHESTGFALTHHPDQPDCVHCHMARERTEDVAHEQVTDHFIRKRPGNDPDGSVAEGDTLTPVGEAKTSSRDLGLAYAQLAIRGDYNVAVRGQELLQEAEKEEDRAGTKDADLHSGLAFLDLVSSDSKDAMKEYRTALSVDPENSVAAADLGVLLGRQHQLSAAVQLWSSAAKHDPAKAATEFNLAVGECLLGDLNAARAALQRSIWFSPDDQQAKSLLAQLQARPQLCAVQARPHP